MNNKKICFIICVNDDHYLEEAIYYLNRLNVPEGYEIDLLTVYEAESMTAGYNEAMRSSDAKYKVYLHQDVFIIERDFISKILEVFLDPQIGLIGMVGCVKFPENAIQWKGVLTGSLISNNISRTLYEVASTKQDDVVTVDGLLMATQYDIPWREDIFDGWDFYDCSQSFEFRNVGYRVVVPFQEKPWVIHYDGIVNLKKYWHYRRLFLNSYCDVLKQFIDHKSIDQDDHRSEEYAVSQESKEMAWQKETLALFDAFYKEIDLCVKKKDTDTFLKLMGDQVSYHNYDDIPEYVFAKLIYMSVSIEKDAGLLETLIDKGNSIEDLIANIINPVRFYLWRMEFAFDEDAKFVLLDLVNEKNLSPQFLSMMISTTSICDDPLSK